MSMDMRYPTTFTVARTTWIRGTGVRFSRLYRHEDGMSCCLGFYCRAAGIALEDLDDLTRPSNLPVELYGVLPEWLTVPGRLGVTPVGEIMRVNDDPKLSDAEREAQLTALFAAQGITVVFDEGSHDVTVA